MTILCQRGPQGTRVLSEISRGHSFSRSSFEHLLGFRQSWTHSLSNPRGVGSLHVTLTAVLMPRIGPAGRWRGTMPPTLSFFPSFPGWSGLRATSQGSVILPLLCGLVPWGMRGGPPLGCEGWAGPPLGCEEGCPPWGCEEGCPPRGLGRHSPPPRSKTAAERSALTHLSLLFQFH